MTSSLAFDSPAPITDDPRWAALLARDPAADGRFLYSVRTTGVYCRPSCGARRAKPENVRFHDTCADAERAGFRPCKRCRPDLSAPLAQISDRIVAACRYIEQSETIPSLAQLADQAGVSAFHFHRQFKAVTGVTPRAYAEAHRAQRLRDGLAKGTSVTRAMVDAGYGSSSRFYSQSGRILGMTPTAYRARGHSLDIRYGVAPCALGTVLVAASEVGICWVALGDDVQDLVRAVRARFADARHTQDDPQFARWVAAVVEAVEHPSSRIDVPLDIRGTAFQQRVWQALREIAPGSTLSYAQLAARIGEPRSARAVAGACAANVLAVLVPCHRVVRGDGSAAGYRWGVERKRALLRGERDERTTSVVRAESTDAGSHENGVCPHFPVRSSRRRR